MATNHVPQLTGALQHGNLALFLGADLPQAVTGLPSRADLATGLGERLALAGPAPPWPEIAARYEASAGLNALISWLRDQLEIAGQGPGPVHHLLAQLPVTTYITTAYDTRLHEALREAGRRPNLPVVDAASLGLLDADRPTVVHLFGTYDRPGSLVLTASQLRQLPQSKAQILAGLVHPTLANRSVLIVGQDLRDTHFQTLYQTALFQAGTIRPSAYAAWPGLEEWEVQTWRGQEVRVVDMSAMELLGELVGEPQATPVPASPPAPQAAPPRRPEPLQFERLHIDPEDVPYSAIRDLLVAAFDAGTLRRFCRDRPAFEPLLRRFSPADGLSELVDEVLEYCRTELLWDDLLAEVAQAKPRQYARFFAGLTGGEVQPSIQAVPELSAQTAAGPSPPETGALPVAPQYRDFQILVGDQHEAGHPVHVLASPAGEGEGVLQPPFGEYELTEILGRLEWGEMDEVFLKEVGTRLFRALFDGDVRTRHAESVGLAAKGAGLRLRLRFDPPELQELPWELARDPEKREFLVLSKRALVTRYLHVPQPTPPLAIEPPLRILAAVSAPQDQISLDADVEVARIGEALRPLLDQGLVRLTVEAQATKRGLRQRLLDDAPHVLHYIGHGGLSKGRGVLLLEDAGGQSDPVDGPTLGTLLKSGSVRLAVLNACLSSRAPSTSNAWGPFQERRAGFLGVGPALVDAGLGAVVAMQFSIADVSARIFAEDFYAMLARFKPVDECVSRAREALLLEVGLGGRDWAAPVLFMRAPDGVLFREEAR